MARIEVVMPQMGESIVEGTIVKWHKKVGERVKKDETLLEISTDKVDSEIPSPASGVLAQIVVEEQKTVPVRTVVAYLETEAGAVTAEPAAPSVPAPSAEARKPEPAPAAEAPKPEPAPSVAAARPPSRPAAPPAPGRFYSPLVLNIARTEGVSMSELDRVPGTGEEGRVTKKDILAYVASRKSGAAPAPPATAPAAVTLAKPVEVPELQTRYPSPQYEVLQMGNVLQRMAEHMVKSVQTSPHVAAIHEVDMTAVVNHRAEHASEFEEKEGFKLTFTPYVAEAVVRALMKYPLVNSSIEGDKIIRKNFVNLGIAVASENGLLVPVVKNAEEKNFVGLARAISDLARRARAKRLVPDDIQGGTFTISNYGVFGTLIGTPIILQPQVGILGTGVIRKRPVVINDAIAIRSVAYFTMSFDHRIVDGALGGTFLEEVVQYLQKFDPATRL